MCVVALGNSVMVCMSDLDRCVLVQLFQDRFSLAHQARVLEDGSNKSHLLPREGTKDAKVSQRTPWPQA